MSIPPSTNPVDCPFPETEPPELDYAFTTPEFMDEYDAYMRLAMGAAQAATSVALAGGWS
jgi:hypothetical protein